MSNEWLRPLSESEINIGQYGWDDTKLEQVFTIIDYLNRAEEIYNKFLSQSAIIGDIEKDIDRLNDLYTQIKADFDKYDQDLKDNINYVDQRFNEIKTLMEDKLNEAITAQSAAEAAKVDAQNSKAAASSAQSKAETAQTKAESAKTSAETAKTAAETAKTDAISQVALAKQEADRAKAEADKIAAQNQLVNAITAVGPAPGYVVDFKSMPTVGNTPIKDVVSGAGGQINTNEVLGPTDNLNDAKWSGKNFMAKKYATATSTGVTSNNTPLAMEYDQAIVTDSYGTWIPSGTTEKNTRVQCMYDKNYIWVRGYHAQDNTWTLWKSVASQYITNVTGLDADNLLTTGTYYYTTAINVPVITGNEGSPTYFMTINADAVGDNVVQSVWSPKTNSRFERYRIADVWSDWWNSTATFDVDTADPGFDFNTVTNPGHWGVSVDTMAHGPVSTTLITTTDKLIVSIIGTADGSTIQKAINPRNGVEFVRYRNLTGTWGSWQYIYSGYHKPTASDIGALPISGGNLTGKVTFTTANVPLGTYHLDMNNTNIGGVNSIVFSDPTDASNEGILFPKTGKTDASTAIADYDLLKVLDGDLTLNGSSVYGEFNKPTADDVGALPVKGGIASATDLNNLTDVGFYIQHSTSNATLAKNYPIAEAGILNIYPGVGNTNPSVMQEYISYSAKRVFIRSLYNNAWNTWKEVGDLTRSIADARYVLKTSEINGIPLNGDIALTASDVGAVPVTRTINSKPLSANIVLSSTDVGALPLSGGTMTGPIVVANAKGAIKVDNKKSISFQDQGGVVFHILADGNSLKIKHGNLAENPIVDISQPTTALNNTLYCRIGSIVQDKAGTKWLGMEVPDGSDNPYISSRANNETANRKSIIFTDIGITVAKNLNIEGSVNMGGGISVTGGYATLNHSGNNVLEYHAPGQHAVMAWMDPSSGVYRIGTSNGAGGETAIRMTVDTTGTVGAAAFTPTSDSRLKPEELRETLSEASTMLRELKPQYYFKKLSIDSEQGFNEFGFIADEVQEIEPRLVIESDDDVKIKSLSVNGIVAHIVKGWQELDERITKLEALIQSIESKLK